MGIRWLPLRGMQGGKAPSQEDIEAHKHVHRLHDGDDTEVVESWCAFTVRILVRHTARVCCEPASKAAVPCAAQIIGLLAWVFALIYVAFLLSLLSAALVSRFSIDPNNWCAMPAEVARDTPHTLTWSAFTGSVR